VIRSAVASLILLLLAAGAAADADRQGKFRQHADILSVCVTFTLQQTHSGLRLNLHAAEPMTLTAMTDMTEESKIWIIEFHETPSGVADVTLHNVKATPSDLDAVWRIVETCAKQS